MVETKAGTMGQALARTAWGDRSMLLEWMQANDPDGGWNETDRADDLRIHVARRALRLADEKATAWDKVPALLAEAARYREKSETHMDRQEWRESGGPLKDAQALERQAAAMLAATVPYHVLSDAAASTEEARLDRIEEAEHTAEPVRTARGDVAPGWTWVGGMTFADFEDEQEIGEHDQFHSPSRAGAGCRLCEEAGWQNC